MNTKLSYLCAKTDEENKKSTDEILFSIIIPTLNEEKNIDLCLKSIVNQTHKNYEVLIMDGGSKDRTLEIVKKNGFELISVPKNRPHDVSGARNEGVKRSKGKYVFFVDADICIDPNTLEVLEEEFCKKNIIGVCLKIQPYMGNKLERVMYEFNNILAWIANKLRIYQLSYFSCHCYMRDYVLKVNGFRDDLLSCEDMDLSLRLSRLGKFSVCNKASMYTSPRRIRQWTKTGYVLKYLKFLVQYYLFDNINDFYEDMNDNRNKMID
ncbi:glycosyltransferase family 2 protein [Candidatus Bathyarchaeota archaeon]|nr:glycosyltransferase family 2 protein [Candidatus Bathyarchaeota archaeon]